LAPTFVVTAFFLIFVMDWPRHRTWCRAVTCAAVFAVAGRYLVWRFTETVLPHDGDGFGLYWIWFVFAIEALAFLDISVFLVAMSRHADRSGEADLLEREFFGRPDRDLPSVDVFIPTYNEPLDVLERTIVGVLALNYPAEKLKVYVLDDGRRAWLKQWCEEKGVNYLTRPDSAYAKAGNLNNGLKASRGDFVAVFDADFVPYANFLRRTLPFFSDPSIGIVQTPQHFFNKDPVQANLGLEKTWPDEQRLFFDEMAACRDAWDISFCCGSCFLARREALEAIGGFPTESITEDLLTTLAMLNKGFKTRYLNEQLSMGLAAENLKGYFVQRQRWCRGGIQTIYASSGPLRGPGLSLFQRVMFMPVSWLVQYFVRLAMLIVPVVYLWTGYAPLHFTEAGDLVSNFLPVLAAYFLLMRWIAPARYLPIVSSAVGAFATFRMLPTVVSSLARPFGKPFIVTPKGSTNVQSDLDTYTFACLAILIALTSSGLVVNLVPEWARVAPGEFSSIAAYWAVANIAVMVIASLICFEKKQHSPESSFRVGESARIDDVDGVAITLALDRAVVEVPIRTRFKSTTVTVRVQAVDPFQAEIVLVTRRSRWGRRDRKPAHYLHLRYALAGQARDQMIVKLYTGRFTQDIREIDRPAVVLGLLQRVFGSNYGRA
jgi:cellulose synthase (UDP-forming)